MLLSTSGRTNSFVPAFKASPDTVQLCSFGWNWEESSVRKGCEEHHQDFPLLARVCALAWAMWYLYPFLDISLLVLILSWLPGCTWDLLGHQLLWQSLGYQLTLVTVGRPALLTVPGDCRMGTLLVRPLSPLTLCLLSLVEQPAPAATRQLSQPDLSSVHYKSKFLNACINEN